MRKKSILLSVLAVVSLFAFWAPFFFHIGRFWGIEFSKAGMDTIVSNFDGLNFIVVEKTWYKPELIEEFNRVFLTNRAPKYFSAHYPLYAGVIWVFDLLLTGPNALLASVVVSNVILALGVYFFFETVLNKKKLVYFLSFVALFLPARMLSIRAVGANEPLFIGFVLSSLAFHLKKKHWLAGGLGALAVLTRSPGMLLFAGYGLHYLLKDGLRLKRLIKDITPYLLMPLALLGLFGFYASRYESFWAYFQSGNNIHLFFPPFQVFSNVREWTSGMWLEDVVYIYLVFAVGIGLLWEKYFKEKRMLVLYPLIYFLTVVFISHRDIARYSLPIAPLVLLGYSKLWEKRWARILTVLLIVPVYLWGWVFILQNVQQVNNWAAFL